LFGRRIAKMRRFVYTLVLEVNSEGLVGGKLRTREADVKGTCRMLSQFGGARTSKQIVVSVVKPLVEDILKIVEKKC